MEKVSDAVSEEERHAGTVVSPGVFVDSVSDTPDPPTGTTCLHPLLKTLSSHLESAKKLTRGVNRGQEQHLDQSLGVIVNLAHQKGVRTVPVEPVPEHGHVNV